MRKGQENVNGFFEAALWSNVAKFDENMKNLAFTAIWASVLWVLRYLSVSWVASVTGQTNGKTVAEYVIRMNSFQA